MEAHVSAILGWLAPILSTIIIAAATASINSKIAAGERKRDEARAETEAKRKAEAEWRARIEERMDEQDERVESVLKGQCTQMRSDVVHRAHRYLDDLGMASTEEKDAFWAEYEEYCNLCEQYGIENNFVDELARRVMTLPEREFKQIPMRALFRLRRN